MLASWKLDPYTVMRLNSGRRGDDVLKGGHLACSSHKPLTSSYSPVTKRLHTGQDLGFCIVYPAKKKKKNLRMSVLDSIGSFATFFAGRFEFNYLERKGAKCVERGPQVCQSNVDQSPT